MPGWDKWSRWLHQVAWGREGASVFPRIVWDTFATALAAGAIDDTAADGVGWRAVTDTESKLTTSGGDLVCSGGKATPAWDDPGYRLGIENGGAIAIVPMSCGYAGVWDMTPAAADKLSQIGFDADASGTASVPKYVLWNTGFLGIYSTEFGSGNLDITTYTATRYRFAIIQLDNLHLLGLLNSAGDEFTLLWVSSIAPIANAYLAIVNNTAAFSVHQNGIIDMSSDPRFASDAGPETDAVASPIANSTATHEADCLIKFTVDTLPSAGEIQVAFRRVDDNNCWIIGVDSAGKQRILENVTGTPTARITGSNGDISNGENVDTRAYSTTIDTYGNAAQIGSAYTSATNFSTATSCKVLSLGTGGAISNLKCYPRTSKLKRRVF